MTTYIVRRLLITIPSLFGLTFVIFMIIQIAPGDFFDQWALQPDLDQRQLRQWKREFGADKGWGVQYLKWLRGVLFDIRFSRERVRIADFEHDDLAGNRDAYQVTGNATAILVKQSRRRDLRLRVQLRCARPGRRTEPDGQPQPRERTPEQSLVPQRLPCT